MLQMRSLLGSEIYGKLRVFFCFNIKENRVAVVYTDFIHFRIIVAKHSSIKTRFTSFHVQL